MNTKLSAKLIYPDFLYSQFLVMFWSSYLLSDFDLEYTFWNILTFKEDNGDIFARGTQDMKSVGIQHIEAIYRLKVLQKKKFKRTIHKWWVKDTIYLFSECTWFFVKFDMIFYLEDVGSKTLLHASCRSVVSFSA